MGFESSKRWSDGQMRKGFHCDMFVETAPTKKKKPLLRAAS
jgi:hypothetical protein